MSLDERAYQAFLDESRKADELHSTIMDISKEEEWATRFPYIQLSNGNLHSFALLQGIITVDERMLLKRYF